MTTTPDENRLEVLLRWIKRIEIKLEKATGSLERFCEENPAVNFLEDPDFLSQVQKEKLAALEWTQSFEKILDHKPETFEDLKFKTLALLDYIKAGHTDERILATIQNDLKSFKLSSSDDTLYNETDAGKNKLVFLLIDDSEADRMLIKEALTQITNNLDFIELDNGTDVVDVIKNKKPSVTLLDIRMPLLDGYDVLKLIRGDADVKEHPVWMLSTSTDSEDIRMAKKTGADGYYTKPNSMDEYSVLAHSILEHAVA